MEKKNFSVLGPYYINNFPVLCCVGQQHCLWLGSSSSTDSSSAIEQTSCFRVVPCSGNSNQQGNKATIRQLEPRRQQGNNQATRTCSKKPEIPLASIIEAEAGFSFYLIDCRVIGGLVKIVGSALDKLRIACIGREQEFSWEVRQIYQKALFQFQSHCKFSSSVLSSAPYVVNQNPIWVFVQPLSLLHL